MRWTGQVNTVGHLAFKVIKGVYHFYGTVDRSDKWKQRVFKKKMKKELTTEQRVQRLMSSHMLVFLAQCVHEDAHAPPLGGVRCA